LSLPRSSRVDEAYTELKARILDGRIAQGFQAPEPEIAALLGMSRTPVREALIGLQAEGLIELIPRRGARVLPLSMVDMAEIYEILAALEPEAAAKLANDPERATKCEDLIASVEEMENALGTGNLEGWAVADDRFHRTLLEKQDNRRLGAFVARLHDQSHRARMATLRLRKPPNQSTKDHRAQAEMILAGDVASVRDAYRSHRERTTKEMLRVLDTYKLTSL
jgi:DNA-binding GntR family transcriptional regulator